MIVSKPTTAYAPNSAATDCGLGAATTVGWADASVAASSMGASWVVDAARAPDDDTPTVKSRHVKTTANAVNHRRTDEIVPDASSRSGRASIVRTLGLGALLFTPLGKERRR